MQTGVTFTRFLIEEQRRTPSATGDFTFLVNDVVTAIKEISHLANRGNLVGVLGAVDRKNVQGETQQKLDVIANDIFLNAVEWTGLLKALASEELETVYSIPRDYPKGKYLLVFDPLDGSSNIDVNVAIGTIFSVLRCPDHVTDPALEDFLQPGTQQICAGYAIYGPSTILVFSSGHGVHGFTLNRGVGEFILTHSDMRIAPDTQEFAINMSNQQFWETPVQRYVQECVAGAAGPRGKYFNMRWIASLVAEVHRILNRGGIFMYPRDTKKPLKAGRLRLLYEANPMAFLIEQAGGAASTGYERILDIKPTALHQRVPVILGARHEVERVVNYHGR